MPVAQFFLLSFRPAGLTLTGARSDTLHLRHAGTACPALVFPCGQAPLTLLAPQVTLPSGSCPEEWWAAQPINMPTAIATGALRPVGLGADPTYQCAHSSHSWSLQAAGLKAPPTHVPIAAAAQSQGATCSPHRDTSGGPGFDNQGKCATGPTERLQYKATACKTGAIPGLSNT